MTIGPPASIETAYLLGMVACTLVQIGWRYSYRLGRRLRPFRRPTPTMEFYRWINNLVLPSASVGSALWILLTEIRKIQRAEPGVLVVAMGTALFAIAFNLWLMLTIEDDDDTPRWRRMRTKVTSWGKSLRARFTAPGAVPQGARA